MRLVALLLSTLALAACAPTAPAPVGFPVTVSANVGVPGADRATARRVASVSVRPKNLVLFVADGFGPASATLGRAAKGAPLSFDSLLVGAVETSASDSRVTDSAASATAYACGVKTYNGAIGMGADGAPCTTLLERAEAAGLATGLVATSRITHATPASFAAHVARRSQEDDIAEQMTRSGVDLLLGGGARYFDGSERDDLYADCCTVGLNVVRSLAELRALGSIDLLDNPAPFVGLFAADHLAYEIDRDPEAEPSLAEMTRRALDLLSASADGQGTGFFVMIEGSRIDHAAHANDPAGHLGDILAYDAAVAEALAWAAADGETLVISTADHETGGMTLGANGVYAWDPAPLLAATASFDRVTARLAAGDDPAAVVRDALGLDSLSAATADTLRAAVEADAIVGTTMTYLPGASATSGLLRGLASGAANLGWTTTGHSAVDVGLYAFGPGAEAFRGAMANDALGRLLVEVLLGEE